MAKLQLTLRSHIAIEHLFARGTQRRDYVEDRMQGLEVDFKSATPHYTVSDTLSDSTQCVF